MSRPRILVIPVEVQARELDAKLLFGAIAAERGFDVILGSQNSIHNQIHRLPRSIYVAKQVTSKSRRMFGILRCLGHSIVAWDEEALVYMSPEFYVRRKVAADMLASVQALFAWGEDNAAIWRAAPGYRGQPLFAAGNPRADLMRPEVRPYFQERVAEIQGRFGSFILVNSNFGGVNHFIPSVTAHRRPGASAAPVAPDTVGTWDDPGMVAHRYGLFQAFREMLPRLARALPHRTLVLRPHPAENQEVWREAAGGCANVHVVSEGNVLPWLLAASAVIQNGCTTGVEAFLLGRPLLAYQPIRNPVYDIWLPNALAHPADDIGGLAELAEAAAEGRLAPSGEQQALARRFVAGLDGPFGSERILDGILASCARAERPDALGWIGGQVAARTRALKRGLAARRSSDQRGAAYLEHEFPDIEAADIEARLDRMRVTLGRFAGVTVRERGRNLYDLRRTG